MKILNKQQAITAKINDLMDIADDDVADLSAPKEFRTNPTAKDSVIELQHEIHDLVKMNNDESHIKYVIGGGFDVTVAHFLNLSVSDQKQIKSILKYLNNDVFLALKAKDHYVKINKILRSYPVKSSKLKNLITRYMRALQQERDSRKFNITENELINKLTCAYDEATLKNKE